jgi:hypothetical protein
MIQVCKKSPVCFRRAWSGNARAKSTIKAAAPDQYQSLRGNCTVAQKNMYVAEEWLCALQGTDVAK